VRVRCELRDKKGVLASSIIICKKNIIKKGFCGLNNCCSGLSILGDGRLFKLFFMIIIFDGHNRKTDAFYRVFGEG